MQEPADLRLRVHLARALLEAADEQHRLQPLAGVLGQYELGREWLEEGLALRRELGDRRAVGITMGNLGLLAARAGEVERGKAIIEEALAVFDQADDAPGQMGMLLILGNVAADAGDADGGRRRLEAHRESAERLLLPRTSGWAALRLAELELAEGDAERAAGLVGEAFELLRPLRDRWGVARCLELRETAAKRPLSRTGEG